MGKSILPLSAFDGTKYEFFEYPQIFFLLVPLYLQLICLLQQAMISGIGKTSKNIWGDIWDCAWGGGQHNQGNHFSYWKIGKKLNKKIMKIFPSYIWEFTVFVAPFDQERFFTNSCLCLGLCPMGTLHGGKEVLHITFEIGQKTLFLPCESFPRDDIKFMVMSKPQYCAIHVMGANLDFFVVKKRLLSCYFTHLF